jgi:DNA repair exonuclease SbcCD ATPase subunit
MWRVVRSFDGQRQRLQVDLAGNRFAESSAWLRLLEHLWPEALLTPDNVGALTTALTRSIYLQQDLVRQFIEADTPQQRFNAVSELIGVGRVTELLQQLDRAKTAWSRATNQMGEGVAELQSRQRSLDDAIESSSRAASATSDVKPAWTAWWPALKQYGIETAAAIDSTEAANSVDQAVKQLSALRNATERHRLEIDDLLKDAQQPPRPDDKLVADLKKRISENQKTVDNRRRALTRARQKAAQNRGKLTRQQEEINELQTLAEIALRHLGDKCPVCNQTYPLDATRERLRQIAGQPLPMLVETQEAVPASSDELERGERRQVELEEQLAQAVDAQRRWDTWSRDLKRRLTEAGIDSGPTDPQLEPTLRQALIAVSNQSSILANLRARGEHLALALAGVGEAARRDELQRERDRIVLEIKKMGAETSARRRTGDLAGRVLDALREASADVVASRLENIEPITQRIYSRIDPHPTFRAVSLLTRVIRGHGQISTVIGDTTYEKSSQTPSAVLSSSQMNALAAAIFLSLNLGLPGLPLKVVMLDDPLQSLDDVNLLGLIDLLRRTKDRRQLVVSTHDRRFAQLLARKLRPVAADQRTVVIELTDWSAAGPRARLREVAPEINPFRIVA